MERIQLSPLFSILPALILCLQWIYLMRKMNGKRGTPASHSRALEMVARDSFCPIVASVFYCSMSFKDEKDNILRTAGPGHFPYQNALRQRAENSVALFWNGTAPTSAFPLEGQLGG